MRTKSQGGFLPDKKTDDTPVEPSAAQKSAPGPVAIASAEVAAKADAIIADKPARSVDKPVKPLDKPPVAAAISKPAIFSDVTSAAERHNTAESSKVGLASKQDILCEKANARQDMYDVGSGDEEPLDWDCKSLDDD